MYVALGFALSVAVALTLTGPLLLFNPWFVGAQQDRHQVAGRLGVDDPTVERVTGELLADLFVAGDFSVTFDTSEPILGAEERSHMSDVGALVRILLLIDLLALIVAMAAGRALRREPRRRGRLLLAATLGIAMAAIGVGAAALFAFDAFFLTFHRLFFREGTFLFGPGSNLIRLFPESFWFEASLAAGAAVALPALALAVLGWSRLRAAEAG